MKRKYRAEFLEQLYEEALAHLAIEKEANVRLQQRLDEFKRSGTGYRCQCPQYEATIEELRRAIRKYEQAHYEVGR